MTILVTGGNGFIGSYVVRHLQEEGERVVCFDIIQPPPKLSHIVNLDKLKFVQGDVQNLAELFRVIKDEKISRIIHTSAALTPVLQKNPMLALNLNVGGTVNVLEAARIMGGKRVTFVSSVTAYGPIVRRNTPEEHPKTPVTLYGVTKLTCEYFGLHYAKEFGVEFIALRFPLIYGWRSGAVKGLAIFSELIEKSWKGEPASIALAEGLDRKFEPLYVKDAAKSVVLATFKEKIKSRIFNVSSGEVLKLREMMRIIKKVIPQSKLTILKGKDQATKVGGSLDLSKAVRELGYRPDYMFDRGVEDYAAYLRSV